MTETTTWAPNEAAEGTEVEQGAAEEAAEQNGAAAPEAAEEAPRKRRGGRRPGQRAARRGMAQRQSAAQVLAAWTTAERAADRLVGVLLRQYRQTKLILEQMESALADAGYDTNGNPLPEGELPTAEAVIEANEPTE